LLTLRIGKAEISKNITATLFDSNSGFLHLSSVSLWSCSAAASRSLTSSISL
jgi:hypothetical protein